VRASVACSISGGVLLASLVVLVCLADLARKESKALLATLVNEDILACLGRPATMEIQVNGEKKAREVLLDMVFLANLVSLALRESEDRLDSAETGNAEQAVFQVLEVLQAHLECRVWSDRKEFAIRAIARCATHQISKRRLRDLPLSP